MSLVVVGTIDQSKFFKDAHNPPIRVGYGLVTGRLRAGHGPHGQVMASSQAGYRWVMRRSWTLQAGHRQ